MVESEDETHLENLPQKSREKLFLLGVVAPRDGAFATEPPPLHA
jgi:hypothetical protein